MRKLILRFRCFGVKGSETRGREAKTNRFEERERGEFSGSDEPERDNAAEMCREIEGV